MTCKIYQSGNPLICKCLKTKIIQTIYCIRTINHYDLHLPCPITNHSQIICLGCVHRLRKYFFFFINMPIICWNRTNKLQQRSRKCKKRMEKERRKKLEKRVLYKVIIYPCNIHSKIHMIATIFKQTQFKK